MAVEALSSTADLEDAREKLVQSVTGLGDDLLDEANVVGEWSVRQTLSHILGWDEWGEEALATMERGEKPASQDQETLCADALEQFKRHSVAEFQRDLRRVRGQLIGRLAAMTDEERADPRYALGGKTISANDFVDGFIEHDLEHASEIRAWRKSKSL